MTSDEIQQQIEELTEERKSADRELSSIRYRIDELEGEAFDYETDLGDLDNRISELEEEYRLKSLEENGRNMDSKDPQQMSFV